MIHGEGEQTSAFHKMVFGHGCADTELPAQFRVSWKDARDADANIKQDTDSETAKHMEVWQYGTVYTCNYLQLISYSPHYE